MKFSCESCSKGFDLPAYIKYTPTIYTPVYPYANPPPSGGWPYSSPIPSQTMIGTNYEYSIPCCPFCYSKNIKETTE